VFETATCRHRYKPTAAAQSAHAHAHLRACTKPKRLHGRGLDAKNQKTHQWSSAEGTIGRVHREVAAHRLAAGMGQRSRSSPCLRSRIPAPEAWREQMREPTLGLVAQERKARGAGVAARGLLWSVRRTHVMHAMLIAVIARLQSICCVTRGATVLGRSGVGDTDVRLHHLMHLMRKMCVYAWSRGSNLCCA
jgi:hypothetical protein